MLPRRRENFEEKQFSFSGPLVMESSDEFETWAERIKSDYGHFGRASNVKVGAWTKRITYVNPDEGEFQGLGRKEDEDVPSPTLWEKEGGGGSRSPATKSDEAYPMLGLTMRSQMMARYRKEMIDLVRDVPENAYELSLRDIVEIPRPVLKTELEVNKGDEKKEKKNEKKKKKGGRRMSRSESLDTGLLLKMFVPATMRSRKSFGAAGTCSKVSPKPMIAEGGVGMEKGPDGEWWKKKDIDELNSSSSSGGSSNGGSTSTSSDSSSSSNNNNNKSNSSNTGRRKKSRCLPFLHFCKSKTRGA